MKLKIQLMTPERILELSHGQILNQKTMNFYFTTPRPEQDGLLCEKIFGPVDSYECKCKDLMTKKHAGEVCNKCGVEVTDSYVRHQRLAHIELPLPIIRPLTDLGLLQLFSFLKKSTIKMLTSYDYGLLFVVNDKGKYIINGQRGNFKVVPFTDEYRKDAYTLPDAILNLDIEESAELNPKIRKLLDNGIDPCNYVLTRIMVSPAGLRPVMFISGMWIIHHHNHLYARIVRRSHRIELLQSKPMIPKIILLNEQKLLQKAVDELFILGTKDNKGKELKSIVDSISSKEGRFRQNLLGKRVDYSGRSMIVCDPSLKLSEVRIPQDMAFELFKPFIINALKCKLKKEGVQYPYRKAKSLYKERNIKAIEILDEVVDGKKLVLLNRNPTLHRYGVQAYWVRLSNYNAIGLHPLVCTGFNSDFDGDQMSVHVPLSEKAFNECKELMLPESNLLSSRDGEPLIQPSREMIIGLYHMTNIKEVEKIKYISDRGELDYLLQSGNLKINESIIYNKIKTCAGRVILCELLDTKIDKPIDKKTIGKMISIYYNNHTKTEMMNMLDTLKDITFEQATLSGLSLSIDDIKPPKNRDKIFKEVEEFCEQDTSKTNELKIRKWYKAIKDLETEVIDELGPNNSLMIMLKTGARASRSQISQLVVAKGLISNLSGGISSEPVKHSLADGLDTFEFYKTIPGSRKSLSDKKLLTPKSGFLERILVSMSRDLYIDGEDCGSTEGIELLEKNAVGRYTIDGKLITKVNDPNKYVIVRSPITCKMKSEGGVCRKCYGYNPATRQLIKNKSSVGVIASQSLIEPTTQLSLRQFHHSGVASIKSSPLAVKTTIDGNIKISDIDSKLTEISIIGKDENRQYLVSKDKCKFLVKDGQQVSKNCILVLYEQELGNEDVVNTISLLTSYFLLPDKKPQSTVVAKKSGVVLLKKKELEEEEEEKGRVEIFIDGEKQGELTNDYPIYYGTGDYIEKGMFLSYGEVNLDILYSECGLAFTGRIFVNRLLDIYKDENITIYPCHLEMIFRAMTEVVIDSRGKYNLRRMTDDIEKICLFGGIKCSKSYPSWFKKASFGWVKECLKSIAIEPQITLDLPSERIMTGELLPYADKKLG